MPRELSQPESRALRDVFDKFQPDFCFNLHGQRTIFGAGLSGKSASVSFLSPAEDEARTITFTRKKAMTVISEINTVLQRQISGQVGVYDDSFNINCVGDTFQSLGVPTVLFEAGHVPGDYFREITREYIFQSLFVGINVITNNLQLEIDFEPYFEIPNNEKCFYDIIIRNSKGGDIAMQYEERLFEGQLDFIPIVVQIGDLEAFFGHREIEAAGAEVLSVENKALKLDSENDFVIVNNERLSLKVKNI